MSTIKKREEISDQFKWDLSNLYSSTQHWEKDCQSLSDLCNQMKEFTNQLNDADTIARCFVLEDEIGIKLERIYSYASRLYHEDTANTTGQSLSDRAKKLIVEAQQSISFITPEILSLSNEQLDELIQHPSLKKYEFTLTEMKREKAHVLSKTEEALLASMGSLSQTPSTIYTMLNNADLKFPNILNEHNEEVELTHGNYIQFLESKNREVRQRAFEAVYETYKKQKNTLAAIFNANINKNIFYAKARKYPSSLEMSLSSDNISKEVYTNLIDTVHKHLPLMYRYMKLRKKLLKVDELHLYDLFAPLVEEFDLPITYDEAKKIVTESCKPLGEQYVADLEKGFNDRWIDVYENEGKYSGAYCSWAYGVHPYVMLNHKDNLNSMFTLTHEMGHALHSYYSDQNLEYRNAHYTIFLAEVASTLNEALLMDYMLTKSTDKKEKMYLLTYFADQFRTTVFRQTMFAEFEKIVHDHVESGKSLTAEDLSSIYYDLNVKYYGDDVVIDEAIRHEWSRIPHFYSSFYVYKYATGFSAAQSFFKQIKDEGTPAVERYLGFLKSGGSDYSISILQRAGVDMSTPAPIEEAMSIFESLIEEMEQLTSN